MTSGSDKVNDFVGLFIKFLDLYNFDKSWELRDLRIHVDTMMDMYERSRGWRNSREESKG